MTYFSSYAKPSKTKNNSYDCPSYIRLNTELRYLKGVGPKRAKLLEKLELRTVEDMLYQIPRYWEDRRLLRERQVFKGAASVKSDANAYLCEAQNVQLLDYFKSPIAIFKARARILLPSNERDNSIALTWIRRRNFRFDVFKKIKQEIVGGQRLLVFGRIVAQKDETIVHVEDYLVLVEERETRSEKQEAAGKSCSYTTQDDFEELKRLDNPHWMRLVPVYPATEGLKQRELREFRWRLLQNMPKGLPCWRWEFLPIKNLNLELISIEEAIKRIHFPSNLKDIEIAQTSLASQEMLLVALGMALRRRKMKTERKPHEYLEGSRESRVASRESEGTTLLFEGIIKRLKIELTSDQKNAIAEILKDMRAPHAMNRLLQGEVGSGKTLVALAAISLAVESAHQCAFVAPTEILAFQHYFNFKKFLADSKVSIALLTSETSPAERAKILEELRGGKIQILLGTHAILSDAVQFKSLALAVIDEQHRFGVKQRWSLRVKAEQPDCLLTTATPIPRTLALAFYGDLDITTMTQLPKQRTIAKALLVDKEEDAWMYLKEHLAQGQKAYVVVPTIENRENSYTLKNQARLIAGLESRAKLAMIHGRMSASEKSKAMSSFIKGDCNVLVATTVVEVGIDVSEATLMVVLGADRFGMATLHQLRGRVGRGARLGLCVLVQNPREQNLNDLLDPNLSHERLSRFCSARSGFEIGKLDLETRGPGALLGFEQHGMADFEYFDFKIHERLIEPLRATAENILEQDPRLVRYSFLRQAMEKKFGDALKASDLS